MPRSTSPILATLLTFAAACGGDAPRDASPPRPGLTSAPPAEIRGSVSATLPQGMCEHVSGEMIGRPELHGASFSVEPGRQILALFGADGSLRFYRDQAAGRTGYTVRLDVDTDSGWVLDRATRTVATGSVADFQTRPDLGPPMAIADSVRRRCGVSGGR